MPASLKAARNRLRRLAQVFGVTPCAAGRIAASVALSAIASAATLAGTTPAISAIRLMADFTSRSRAGGNVSPLDKLKHVA